MGLNRREYVTGVCAVTAGTALAGCSGSETSGDNTGTVSESGSDAPNDTGTTSTGTPEPEEDTATETETATPDQSQEFPYQEGREELEISEEALGTDAYHFYLQVASEIGLMALNYNGVMEDKRGYEKNGFMPNNVETAVYEGEDGFDSVSTLKTSSGGDFADLREYEIGGGVEDDPIGEVMTLMSIVTAQEQIFTERHDADISQFQDYVFEVEDHNGTVYQTVWDNETFDAMYDELKEEGPRTQVDIEEQPTDEWYDTMLENTQNSQR
jgi:hypothetical protein